MSFYSFAIAVACGASVLWAQPPKPLCSSPEVIVVTKRLIYIRCNEINRTKIQATADLMDGLEARKTDLAAPLRIVQPSVPVTLAANSDSDLIATLAADLQKGKQYALIVKAQLVQVGGTDQPGPWATLSLPVSTEPKATVDALPSNNQSGWQFQVKSPVALRSPVCDPRPHADKQCHTSTQPPGTGAAAVPSPVRFFEVLHAAFVDPANPSTISKPEKRRYLDAVVQVAAPVDRNSAGVDEARRGATPASLGKADFFLNQERLTTETAYVGVTGLKNIFDDDVVLDPTQSVGLSKVPKGKDDAIEYFKLSHSAGPHAKPTWQADTKLLPIFAYAKTYYHHLNVTTDIGGGQGVNVSDLVHLGYFAERTYKEANHFFLRPAPGFTYETNRSFKQQNLLFNGDLEFRFEQIYKPLKERSRSRYVAAVAKNPNLKPEQVEPAPFGAGLQFFFGLETGRSLVDVTTQNKAKTQSVTTTPYGIARLRPRARAFLETKMVSFEVNVLLRYLALEEQAGKVVNPDDKASPVILRHPGGARPYGDVSINFPLDRGRHISLNTKYKLGSQPPFFNRINTVQSGLQIAF